jgi:hypothetical protein
MKRFPKRLVLVVASLAGLLIASGASWGPTLWKI